MDSYEIQCDFLYYKTISDVTDEVTNIRCPDIATRFYKVYRSDEYCARCKRHAENNLMYQKINSKTYIISQVMGS